MSEPSDVEKPETPNRGGDLSDQIRTKILRRDRRYELAAYFFIYEALAYTQRKLGRQDPDLEAPRRHVTGRELLDGIREYAAESFGPLAPTVFRSWGVRRTEDFGELVFNLVENGLLGKTDEDRREDFADGFDFDTAFDEPVEGKSL